MHHVRTIIVSIVFGALLAVGASAGGDRSTLADDFRIDNAVYAGDQKEPLSQTTTIYRGGVVYDYRKAPAEIAVFDRTAGRFTLLDVTHKTRTELTTAEVAAFNDRLQQRASESSIPWVKFLAEAKFHEQFDEATGQLTLSSPWVSYRLTLSHEVSPSIVEQYHDACDWFARLGWVLFPGSPPPFGRLVVNAAMANRQAMPSQVVLIVAPDKEGQQQSQKRSEHRLVRSLDAGDLQRVAQAREFMGSFKPLSFEQYRKN
jgi:hypothetical protein